MADRDAGGKEARSARRAAASTDKADPAQEVASGSEKLRAGPAKGGKPTGRAEQKGKSTPRKRAEEEAKKAAASDKEADKDDDKQSGDEAEEEDEEQAARDEVFWKQLVWGAYRSRKRRGEE